MQLGVIEGFYGRVWTPGDRRMMTEYLPRLGYSSFIYAPKADKKLRSQWRVAWDGSEMEALLQQAQGFAQCELGWGVGLSPMGLNELTVSEVQALERKLQQISALSPSLLCLLFDDMPGGRDDLAATQLQIVERVSSSIASETKLIVCPTYYSFDPILEELFAARPENYWMELGRQLDPAIDIFWTGDKVCSDSYPAEGLSQIADLFQRKPVLWDNYPVNDSRSLSPFIRVEPFTNREPWLRDYIAAHFVNPMNQASLSLLPLATLSPVYARATEGSSAASLLSAQQSAWREMLAELAVQPDLFEQAREIFAAGLPAIGELEKGRWRERFLQEGSPAAAEVVDWLDGAYVFDPDCLTD